MKLSKPFRGVPDGEIYPIQYEVGDECPKELESAAITVGAIEQPKARTAKNGNTND